MNDYNTDSKSTLVVASPFLTIEEFCSYMRVGKSKGKEMLASPTCRYKVHIGRKVLIHKGLLDKEIEKAAKFAIVM